MEQESLAASGAEKLSLLLADIGAPDTIGHTLLELSKKFGPELLTAVLGYISICLINKGSRKYGQLTNDMSAEDRRGITQEASEQIALGSMGMATTAFAAGNPLFALPEVVAVIGSLKPYLENKYESVASLSNAARLDVLVKAAAIGVGGYVTVEHARTAMEALPPISLTALSIAFSGHIRQEVYRALTFVGGTGLVVGSAYAAQEAHKADNAVGTIMSLAFFALNTLFTANEWKEIRKMGGVRKMVQGVCTAVAEKVQKIFGLKVKQ